MRTRITVNDLIFIGIKGGVVALHARDGQEVWQSKLKGSQFTNITRENGRLLAATRGELFCLDPATGEVLWHNPLRGMGFGLITFATAPQTAAAAQQLADDAAASSAAATTTSPPPGT